MNTSSVADGGLRLVGGSSGYEGRLEVFYNGAFGMVCDDRFTDTAAQVACRQMGMSGGEALCCGAFGPSPGSDILLDEVTCLGNETRLEQCRHSRWGQHDCEPGEAVGVRCSAQAPPPPPPPRQAYVPDLSETPSIQCLAWPPESEDTPYPDYEGGQCDNYYLGKLAYHGPPGVSTLASYRVVFVYPSGAHSCPSPVQMDVKTKSSGPDIFLRSRRYIPSDEDPAEAPVMVVQRRGYVSTILGMGPGWLNTTWIDSFYVGQGKSSWTDGSLFYNASEGTLSPSGPDVVGWRWRYGSSGLTDGYTPTLFPDLTCDPDGGGINATYQLVYELSSYSFSFPSPKRFVAADTSASAPLWLYVQLASGEHPGNMVALLLQRVEGDSVWTVARLGADSPEIISGQRAFVFRDATSRLTSGCPGGTGTDRSVLSTDSGYKLPAVRSLAAQDASPPVASPPSPSPPSSPPPPASLAAACRLTLLGWATGVLNTSAPFRRASLDCWGAAPDGSPPAVTVQVGQRLLPLLSYSGVYLAPASNVSSGSSGNASWGLSFLNVDSLTLVDSVIADLPLSPHGPLLECRNCGELTFSNVSIKNLAPPASTTGFMHGVVAASAVTRAALTDVTCSGVRGAHGWACLLLTFKGSTTKPPALSMTRCTFTGNSVAYSDSLDYRSSGIADPMLQLTLQGTFDSPGAGAIALLRYGEDPISAYPGTLTLSITDSALTGSSGIWGGAIYSTVPMDAVTVTNTTISKNTAIWGGGGLFFMGNVTRLLVQHGSALDGNSATYDAGGAVCVGGAVGSFSLTGGSSMSRNSARSSSGGVLAAARTVGSVSVTDRSTADYNSVSLNYGFGGFVVSDGDRVKMPSTRTVFLVSGGSSVSNNSAYAGGVLSTFGLQSFTVADGSRVDGNTGWKRSGVLLLNDPSTITGGANVTQQVESIVIDGGSSMSYNSALFAGALYLTDKGRLQRFAVSNGSRFEGNSADSSPAGLWCGRIGSLEVSGNATVASNTATTQYEGGGGVFHANEYVDTFLVASGGRIANNSLGTGGGAVLYTKEAGAIIVTGRNSAVELNTAWNGTGGFTTLQNLGSLEVSDGGRLDYNAAPASSGGALAVNGNLGLLNVTGGSVSNNAALLEGGAISVGNNIAAHVLVSNGATVMRNKAATFNGGFLSVGFMVRGQVRITNGSRLCGCSAGVSGGAIAVADSIADGVIIRGNSTACDNLAETGDGGAIYAGVAVSGLAMLAGGCLEGNRAGGAGGAVYAGKPLGNVTIASGSRVVGNRADANGGALCADAINELSLSDGSTASGNTAGGDGGFAYAQLISSISMSSSTLSANRAGRSGGAVALVTLPDSVVVVGSRLSRNIAERGAGGVLSVAVPQPGSPLLSRVTETHRVSFSLGNGSEVSGNGAYLDGGAFSIAAEAASYPTGHDSNAPRYVLTATIDGATFSSNYAGGAGGAFSLVSPSAGVLTTSVLVRSSTFAGNAAGSDMFRLGSTTSSGYGGAIAVSSTPKFRADAVMARAYSKALLLQKDVAASASANNAMSSVSQDSACSLLLEGSAFSENRCQGSGGAVAAVSCPTTMRGCNFTENTAGAGGGAVASMVELVPSQVVQLGSGSSSSSDAANGTALSGAQRRSMQRRLTTDGGGGSAASAANAAADEESKEPSVPWWLGVQDSLFEANSATADCGGGVYAELAPGVGTRIGGTTFRGNAAPAQNGGGLCVITRGSGASEAVLHDGTQLLNNTAGGQGGGVFASLGGGAGNVLALGAVTLSNNSAAQGGALFAAAAPGARAALTGVTAAGNVASAEGGALYVQCRPGNSESGSTSGDDDVAPTCRPNAGLSLKGCSLLENVGASGGAVYASAGASVELYDSQLTANLAAVAGGGVAGVGCSSLTAVNISVEGGFAGKLGGGVYTESCARTLLHNTTLLGNSAVTGGGAFLAGPSDDDITLQSAAQLTGSAAASAPAAVLLDVRLVGNKARSEFGGSGSGDQGTGYQRFRGLGGGVFAHGNVSLLVSNTDMSASNEAVAGAALASSQSCGSPEAGKSALDTVAPQVARYRDAIAAANVTELWDGLGALSASSGCWPLLLHQVQLPGKKDVPLWMHDPSAGALQARCSSTSPDGGAATATPAVLTCDPSLLSAGNPASLRACELTNALAACSNSDAADNATATQPGSSASVRLDGAFLDVAPTHMRPDSAFHMRLRPGTPTNISVRLYNGLSQPVQRDTLPLTVTVSIEPADPASPTGGNASSGLRPAPERPWQDASIAYLDPGTTGGFLTVSVANGSATWPYLTARGWPGEYVLVFTATSAGDTELYQITPLRLRVELQPCLQGEALDRTWTKQANASAAWLACSRCDRGRFTLWRDDRPALAALDTPDYLKVIEAASEEAVEGEAACAPCVEHATCLGGGVLVPETGYWHSAPDSALFHRCLQENACGGSVGIDDEWASMPSMPPTRLQVGFDENGAVTLIDTITNTSVTDGSALAAARARQLQAPAGGLTLGSVDDARSGWLALCQQLGYQQAVAASSSTNSTGGLSNADGTTGTGGGIGSLEDLVVACRQLWSGPGTSAVRMYLQLECSTGYTGPLCAACTPGYFISPEFECQGCPSSLRNTTLAILAFLGGVALVLYTSLTTLTENYEVEGTGGGGQQESADKLESADKENGGHAGQRATSDDDEELSPSELLKVAIVHAQYYVIITRLPVPYPDVITRLSGAVSAATGAESSIAFSYSCFFPGQESDGQARAQLLGALIVPAVIAAFSLALWTFRYLLLNSSRLGRATNLRRRASSATGAAAAVELVFPEEPTDEGLPSGSQDDEAPERHDAETVPTVAATSETAICMQLSPVEPHLSHATHRHPHSADHPPPAAEPRDPEAQQPTKYSRQADSLRVRAVRAIVTRVRTLKNNNFSQTLTRLDETLGLMQQLGVVLMLAAFILYPGWAQAALSIFACYRIDDGSGPFPDRQQAAWSNGYWIRDMQQRCYTGTHLRLYTPVGIVAVILVCLGPPLTSFALLWAKRHRLEETSVRRRYGFLYTRYKPQYFYWESVLMLQELVLVIVEVFGRALPVVSHQILLMLAVFIALSIINMACAPVRNRHIVLFEFLSLGVLSLTVTLSLYFVVSQNLSKGAANTVGIIILVVNVALLLGFICLVLCSSWGAVQRGVARLATATQKLLRVGRKQAAAEERGEQQDGLAHGGAEAGGHVPAPDGAAERKSAGEGGKPFGCAKETPDAPTFIKD